MSLSGTAHLHPTRRAIDAIECEFLLAQAPPFNTLQEALITRSLSDRIHEEHARSRKIAH